MMADVMWLLQFVWVVCLYSCEGSLKAFLLKRYEENMRFPGDVRFAMALRLLNKARLIGIIRRIGINTFIVQEDESMS